MKKADSEAHVERLLASALKSEPEIWTPDCLPPEQIIALIERALPEPEARPHMAHIALCARCRREYAETVELFQLAEEVGTLQARSEELPAIASPPPRSVPAEKEDRRAEVPRPPDRPSFWERWLVPFRRSPGLGFALGAAAACIVLFAAWNVQRKAENDVQGSKLTSLQLERDSQMARAERAEQEKQRLEQQLAAGQQNQGETSQLAQKISSLNLRLKKQGIQIARLTDSDMALRQMPLPTAGWIAHENIVRGGPKPNEPAPAITLLHPLDVTVADARPVLECRPVSGATDYQISLESNDVNLIIPVPKALSATRWQPAVPLAPGKVYNWSVTAQRNKKQINSQAAKFYVLSAAEQKEIEAARQKFAHNPLALGAVYARLGLKAEAAQQFRAALKSDPSQEAAKRWLKEIETPQK